jgi:tetratricopeptide (TPR) repeat protein
MMFNPDENVYKEEYVYNALNCFDRLKGDEEKADMRENISITLDSIPEREKGYYFHLEEANVASLLAFYIDQSYNAEAEARFTRLLADYPNLSQPIMYYAYHKMRQKEYGEILRLTASATEVLPPLTLPLDGWNYMHRETVAEEWARFYDLTALAAEMSGDYDTAIQNYKNELRANPYKLPVYKKIADIHYKKKDLDAALWYNERGYSLNRSDHSWPLAIGLLLEEKGDKEGAQAYFSEAERLRASTEKNDDQDFGGDLFTDDSRIK